MAILNIVKEGDEVKVKVIGIDEKGKLSLSIKKADETPASRRAPEQFEVKKQESSDFEDMMTRFMSRSKDKMSELKERGTVDIKRRRPR